MSHPLAIARLGLGVDTVSAMPQLRALTRRLAEEPAFRATKP